MNNRALQYACQASSWWCKFVMTFHRSCQSCLLLLLLSRKQPQMKKFSRSLTFKIMILTLEFASIDCREIQLALVFKCLTGVWYSGCCGTH